MAVEARVRVWHDEEGWGVLDSPETPGGCWVHFSHIEGDGYRSLRDVDTVELEYEEVPQDGCPFTAARVRVPGRPAAAPSASGISGAYTSSLTLALGDGRVVRSDGHGNVVENQDPEPPGQ